MDCVVTPLKTLMGFSVHLNVQLKFYNLPLKNLVGPFRHVVWDRKVDQPFVHGELLSGSKLPLG
ncbi:hypothetical protein CEW18_06485 [Limosilactobacillus fermentum]|nr:hypothetical protein CEW18_06485 [Limosilactobacillus fermentum]